jgi:endoglucanase
MKSILYPLLIIVLVGACSSDSFSQKELPIVKVNGNKFVTASENGIIFRGLDASDPDKLAADGHWNAEYFNTMKSWGANIVRFPVHPRAWQKRGADAYLALMDQGVEWARAAGMYVIIDWHSIGNLKDELFQNEMYNTTKKETFEFWKTIAVHYKDNTTVAFFELFNEPTVYNGKLGSCTWPEWKTIIEAMIDTIRAAGAKAIPLVGGFNWAYDLKPVASDPINREFIAYVSHPYPMKRDKPWEEKWTADWGFVSEKYPVILTEVGFCGADDKGAHVPVIGDESYGDAITKYTGERGISYTVWVFDPQWAPMLISDWSFTPTRQGRYFKTALQKASGKQ